MSDRITEIKVEDLTVEHLWLTVEVDQVAGQLIRYARTVGSTQLLLGPAQDPKVVRAYDGSTIKVLDAPQPERKTFNFGASE